MKRKIYLFILAVSFISLITSITFKVKYNKFSCNKTIDDIKYLSSEKLEGRLPGSSGNSMASDYIEKEFKKSGLEPLKENYKQYFTLKTPKHTVDSASLSVKDSSGKILKSFSYLSDFKEDFINFRTNELTFNSTNQIMIFPTSIIVFKDKTSFLFYVPKEKDFNFRSSFSSEFNSSFAIKITENTYNEILSTIRNGNSISCHVPYTIETAEVCNVAGIIKGRNPELPPLVLTAHFDHLGVDNNLLYSGALDNASGTSFLLQLARTYGSMTQPDRDVIFVAFNAEEYGLLGSKNFVETNLDILQNATVLNFDMMGSNKKPSLSLMATNENNPLLSEFRELYKNNDFTNIKTMIGESSDHASFAAKNINSITFSEDDTSRIHTPKDTASNIIPETFNRNYVVLNKYIMDECYDNYFLIVYNNYLLIGSFTIFILSYILSVKKTQKQKRIKINS